LNLLIYILLIKADLKADLKGRFYKKTFGKKKNYFGDLQIFLSKLP